MVGSLFTSPKEICKLLADYYTSLYSEDSIDQKVAEALLAKMQLTSAHLEVLNAPISLDYIKYIKSLASCKAQAPDGYTAKFYKLKDFIPDTLKHVFGSVGGRSLPPHWNSGTH